MGTVAAGSFHIKGLIPRTQLLTFKLAAKVSSCEVTLTTRLWLFIQMAMARTCMVGNLANAQ
jgi:hypothetical protein